MHGKSLSYRECYDILEAHGYELVRFRGDHAIFTNGQNNVVIKKAHNGRMSMKTWKRECRRVGIEE